MDFRPSPLVQSNITSSFSLIRSFSSPLILPPISPLPWVCPLFFYYTTTFRVALYLACSIQLLYTSSLISPLSESYRRVLKQALISPRHLLVINGIIITLYQRRTTAGIINLIPPGSLHYCSPLAASIPAVLCSFPSLPAVAIFRRYRLP